MSKEYYSQLIEEKYSCPFCNSRDIQLDATKGEIYCSLCGLVISDPSGEGVLPYDYRESPATHNDNQKEITNYRHSFTNRQLMRYR